MKNILLAFDGTGNNAVGWTDEKWEGKKSFTHVLRLHWLAGGDVNGKINDSIPGQISLYERGVGARNFSFLGCINFALGILWLQKRKMRKRLEEVYEPGDKLFLLGFSRGSSAAREFAMELYNNGLHTKNHGKVEQPPIEFLGCFDTVSIQSQNIKTILENQKNKVITKSEVLTENGKIAPNVKQAVHNVAMDDNRQWGSKQFMGLSHFPPVLMGAEERVNEVWFPGEHGDIGGNYSDRKISDGSCAYMKEWMEHLGIKFLTPDKVKPECIKIDWFPDVKITEDDLKVNPDATGNIHQSIEIGMMKTVDFTPSYRVVHAVRNDETAPDIPVKIHENVLLHLDSKKGNYDRSYNMNLKNLENFVVVGSLGKELPEKTEKLKDLLKEADFSKNFEP